MSARALRPAGSGMLPWLGLALLIAAQAVASEALLLRQNDSKVLRFCKMKRVWVADPAIIDVVVASYDELMVYTKGIGQTKLCVWDRAGRHEYAVEVRGLPTAEQIVREIKTRYEARLKEIFE